MKFRTLHFYQTLLIILVAYIFIPVPYCYILCIPAAFIGAELGWTFAMWQDKRK